MNEPDGSKVVQISGHRKKPAVPRDWYLVILLRDMLLMQINDTRAEAQQWLDAFTVCPETYEIIHVREVAE